MMGASDETLMRITAQFVAAQEAGQQPRMDDYIRRYPQYAEEIADFMIYYYALEADLPAASEETPPLSLSSHVALNAARRERPFRQNVAEASAPYALSPDTSSPELNVRQKIIASEQMLDEQREQEQALLDDENL